MGFVRAETRRPWQSIELMDSEPLDSPRDFPSLPESGPESIRTAPIDHTGSGVTASSPVWYEPTGGILPPFPEPRPYKRRVILPLLLFLATCLTTFSSGTIFFAGEVPVEKFPDEISLHKLQIVAEEILHRGWPAGLTYMVAVMSILLAHEMGHFLQAVRYKVPASFPLFIPMPLPPIGTMGAVIRMSSSKADRRQLFDIGISGPLAGLVVAIPIAWFGIQSAHIAPVPANAEDHGLVLQDPLLIKAITRVLHPEIKPGEDLILSPLLLASWVGMLITGLNMLPVSQLDGGHISYALFGRRAAHAISWLMVAATIVFIVHWGRYDWMLMLALVVLIGPAHPPTSDDHVPLGFTRRLIGLASLLIPVLCFVPMPIQSG